MIDLPVTAQVQCSDGPAGLSTYVIENPIKRQVTYLVVKSLLPPFQEYLVPVEKVEETSSNQIKLNCTRKELEQMELFEYEEYIRYEYPTYLYMPYVMPTQPIEQEEIGYAPVRRRNVPEGEIAVWRGAKVKATDGYVGQVDELLINSANMEVTHLVLLERHIFEQKEITIPVSQIDRVYQDTIYLKLDRKSVEEMPSTPIQRWKLQEKLTA